MTADEARARFASGRVAHLSTVGADGHPHIVPIVFVCAGDVAYTGVDAKPKRSKRLRRLENIAAEPRVSVLVDRYSDDWTQLWWVRADGEATVLDPGTERDDAIAALVDKYERYRREPPSDVIVRIDVRRWRWWSWA